MEIENIKHKLGTLEHAESSSFQELADLADGMRCAANDVMTDGELALLLDECAARIECFLAMAAPGVRHIEEAVESLLLAFKIAEADHFGDVSGGLQ